VRKAALSIGLPVYNGERYLSRAVNSLLNQDFEDFELIISDNDSSDGTESICRAFARKDRRIRYMRSDKNRGATWNFRRVFELAQGDYFKYAAYDDECYPTMVRRCMEMIIEGGPTVALAYTRSEVIDENSAVIPRVAGLRWDSVATAAKTPHERLRHVLWWVLHGQAYYGIMRSAFLRQTRPFGSVAADWVILAQLAMLGRIVEVPEVLFRFRKHSSNSWDGTRTPLQILRWHNPEASGLEKLLPFRISIMFEHMKSVSYLPLSRFEKIMCLPVACLTPPLRSLWIWLLRISGPARKYLRTATGCKALHPSDVMR
jgi:glycosyltransferase involved in cell wall biosynthesis